MWLPSFSLLPLPYVLLIHFRVLQLSYSSVLLLILDALQFLACLDQIYPLFYRLIFYKLHLFNGGSSDHHPSLLPLHLNYIPSHTYSYKILTIFDFS